MCVCVKDKVSGTICSLYAIHELWSFERSISIYRDGGNKESHWEWDRVREGGVEERGKKQNKKQQKMWERGKVPGAEGGAEKHQFREIPVCFQRDKGGGGTMGRWQRLMRRRRKKAGERDKDGDGEDGERGTSPQMKHLRTKGKSGNKY